MADELTNIFDRWKANNPEGDFASFQAGFTASSISMRQRAMKLVQDANKDGKLNDLVNKVGQLSDIPPVENVAG